MDGNIYELLEEIRKNKEEQNKIVLNMSDLRREYDASMQLLQNQYANVGKRISEIGNLEFPVRLGDLIEEICWLSNANSNEIQISMRGNTTLDGTHNLNEYLKFVGNRPKCNIQFRLSNRDGKRDDEASVFNYSNPVLFDLNSIQADGKTLFEHCSVITRKYNNGSEYTELVIDKNIEDVILPITLNYISLGTSVNWLPADLFTQAVINSVERYRENTKVLKRTKETK